MNNRGIFFDLDPSSASVIAPHKRPFLTIIPAFVMKDGEPLLAFGNMGGDEQAQAQATEIVNMIDLGMNIQAAGDAARFHHSQDTDRVDLESNLFDLVGARCERWATTSSASTGKDDLFGGYQAILFQVAPGLDPPKRATPPGSAGERRLPRGVGLPEGWCGWSVRPATHGDSAH